MPALRHGVNMYRPPRWSEFLRSTLSEVTSRLQAVEDDPALYMLQKLSSPKDSAAYMVQLRKDRINRLQDGKNSWIQLSNFILEETRQNKEVIKNLNNIYELAKQLVLNCDLTGDFSQKTDEAAMMVLYILLNEDHSSVRPSRELLSEFTQYFGKIDQSIIADSKSYWKDVFEALNHSVQDSVREKLNSWKTGEGLLHPLYDDETQFFPFGKIKLDYLDPQITLEQYDHNDNRLLNIISKSSTNSAAQDEKIIALLSSLGQKEDAETTVKMGPSNEQSQSSSSSFFDTNMSGSTKWDRSFLLNLIGNQDILEAVLPIITSEKSNDEIQEHLFDLLGFDQLELIMNLLENRDCVKKAILKEEALALAVRNQVNNRRPTENHPVIGVRVQSEDERVLEKVYRKETKKAMKSGNTNTMDSASVYSAEAQVGQNMINKMQNGAAAHSLRAASGIGAELEVGEYPNVFDSFANAKQKAGFISGVKMVLPDNVIRKQTQETEEVSLPAAAATVPAHIAKKPLIKISELDGTCQLVFRGMKSLNRIQSLVYETAYKTNENLLICAPTGAGKTNIALLCILRCIENNTENGTIQKDLFKIVYVAPMKALAAEMTSNFSKKLAPLGIQVRELTGDMQLTKAEISATQILVTTPEKWDVVTRKSTGDVGLAQIVKLLIIDEVHLLHGDRGPVVESLVARTLRQIESSQKLIRIVGLSATLPNYLDVALFLRVNPRIGLYHFDARFRPVPLGQTFVGVKALSIMDQMRQMDTSCYEKVHEMVSKGHQVMVFVHARNATVKTAEVLIELAGKKGQLETFSAKHVQDDKYSDYVKALKSLEQSRNKKLGELFAHGFACHHAGMLRTDRSLIERLFSEGLVKVLVCTATLAWGVNLPAHAVVIKGTEIYDAKQGAFVDLGILDVLQIFGRAGRPQFDNEGHGTIITTHDKLAHYLSLLTNQFPIESSFIKFLADNLNAEVALGSVTNIDEAVEWLSYTYLYIRMRRNPQLYGMQINEVREDPLLTIRRKELVVNVARDLDKAMMLRFDERTEYLHSTDMGRTASHFYLKYETIEMLNETMLAVMNLDSILMMISKASEFEQLKVRDEELDELDDLTKQNCYLKVWGGSENVHGKVNILIQTYISRGYIKSFSLVSDQQYVVQNAIRICRGFFEIVLRRNNPLLAGRLLQLSLMLEQQIWDFSHPLKQHKALSYEIMEKIEMKKISIDTLRETSPDEIGAWINHRKQGAHVKKCAEEFPFLQVDVLIQPITRNVLRIKLQILPDFRWNDRMHGNVSASFWIWVEDPDNNFIYHHEYFILTKKQVVRKEVQDLVFTIPVTEPLPPQYYVRISSDTYLGAYQTIPVSFQHLILPEHHLPHTELLDLNPLPISALKDKKFEALYADHFQFFNPIQTQIFHCLYHTDTNALIGAPTGSGKTIAAELAMFRVFKQYPSQKVVYIAPLKALVRERMIDWKNRLETKLGKKVVELTGDVTPDIRAITESDIIVTTPEKWDGVSRSWQTRSYVQSVGLIVIDEIHLLGEDRGPVLEVIVSRRNFISQHTRRNVRVIGLSTALANARDLGDWLGLKGTTGLYNFKPSVRPVPTQVHIQGFPGKHYCPRMATMNKPAFQAIREHSPSKPVLIFVSSRRQTRLTALDLIAYLAAEGNPKQWLHVTEDEIEQIIFGVKEPNLKLTLSFGIGIHHAGLQEKDRRVVEELFVNQKIQILIATATLAWGVNFPAHLVIVKGTEYFDGKSHRYVDMPITDILQMIGRAGRPQYDNEAVAVVLVHDQKKNFYKKFLYEPFPVESQLLDVLPDHLNAEVVAGTISTTQEALDYLTYTYFFRRLIQNPSYYGLESAEGDNINQFLSGLISKAFSVLQSASCVFVEEDLRQVAPTSPGRIAAYYYLSHQTMQIFRDKLNPTLSMADLLSVMTDVYEYSQLPVRHNEDLLNEELSKSCPLEVAPGSFNSPHTKAHLLLQCHFSHQQLPSSDYYTDLKSVLDQSIRILQAMIDTCAEQGWLSPTISCINLMQMIIQARWLEDSPLTTLPHMDFTSASALMTTFDTNDLPVLQERTKNSSELFEKCLLPFLDANEIHDAYKVLQHCPSIGVEVVAHFDNEKVPLDPYTERRRVWTDLPPNKDVVLTLNFTRLSSFPKDLKVYAPRFSKAKDEGWFAIVGDVENRDVIALKRVGGIKRKSQQQLYINTGEKEGRVIYTLYLLSDSYLGWDQQYEFSLNITSGYMYQDDTRSFFE